MEVLIFFIFIPLVCFVGFYIVGRAIMYLWGKIFHKSFSKIWIYVLFSSFATFYFMVIMDSIAFEKFNPQYYEFKRLCDKTEDIVYDEELLRIYKATRKMGSYYDEKTQKEYHISQFGVQLSPEEDITRSIKRRESTLHYNKEIAFYHEEYYVFNYWGIFLRNDKTSGWGWHFENQAILACAKTIKY